MTLSPYGSAELVILCLSDTMSIIDALSDMSVSGRLTDST